MSRTADDIENTGLELFNWEITVSISSLIIGTIKKECIFLSFKNDVALLSDGGTSDASLLAMLVK